MRELRDLKDLTIHDVQPKRRLCSTGGGERLELFEFSNDGEAVSEVNEDGVRYANNVAD